MGLIDLGGLFNDRTFYNHRLHAGSININPQTPQIVGWQFYVSPGDQLTLPSMILGINLSLQRRAGGFDHILYTGNDIKLLIPKDDNPAMFNVLHGMLAVDSIDCTNLYDKFGEVLTPVESISWGNLIGTINNIKLPDNWQDYSACTINLYVRTERIIVKDYTYSIADPNGVRFLTDGYAHKRPEPEPDSNPQN